MTINGGTVTSIGYYYGINVDGSVTINGGSLTAIGNRYTAIGIYSGNVTAPGLAVKAGNAEKSAKTVAAADVKNKYKYVHIEEAPPHIHSFTYSASGGTITAKCTEDCDITTGLALTISAPDSTTYDGMEKAAAISAGYNTTAFPDGGSYEITYKRDGSIVDKGDVRDAGNYTAEITVGSATASVSFVIGRRKVTVSGIAAEDKIYDGTTDATLNYDGVLLDGRRDGDDLSITATGAFADADAGEDKAVEIRDIALAGDSKDNYILATEGQQKATAADIDRKSITGAMVKLNIEELDYNGSDQTVSVTDVTIDNLTLTEDDYSVAGNTTREAGDYTVTVAGEGNLRDDATAAWHIVAKAMTVNADNAEVTYDGAAHGIAVNVVDPAEGAVIKYGTTDGACDLDESPSIQNVADGPLTVYYKVTAANYKDYTGSATVTIDRAAVTVAAKAVRKIYGAADPELTYTASGLVGGDVLTVALTREAGEDVGAYAILAETLSAGDNYAVSYTGVNLTIEKASAGCTPPTAKNLSYTGGAQALVDAGSAFGGTMRYSLDNNTYTEAIPTGTDAGTYTVYYKVAGDSNHYDTDEAHIDVTIGPAEADVTSPGADGLTFNGVAQALVTGGSVTGGELRYALGNDAVTAPEFSVFTTDVPVGENAGTYFVWYRIQGDENHNDVAPACIEVSIGKAEIVPRVAITGWTYGESANAPELTEGNPGGGEVTFSYSDAADGDYTEVIPVDAGTYYVKATVAESGNYKGGEGLLSFAIAKAGVTLVTDDKTGAYGEDIVPLTYQQSGTIADGDDLGIEVGTTARKDSDVGEYPIAVTWNDNPNYSVTLTDGIYTIVRAAGAKEDLTGEQKAEAIDSTYDGSAHALVAAPAGLPAGYIGTEYSIDGGSTWTDVVHTATEAGAYTVRVKYVGDDNHNDFEGYAVTAAIRTQPEEATPAAAPAAQPIPQSLMIASMRTVGKRALKLSWTKVADAEGYDIFFGHCGKQDLAQAATVGSSTYSYMLKGLAKFDAYKAYVRAWRMVDGVRTVIGESPATHAITGGYTNKYTNPKKVNVKKTRIRLAVGKTAKIRASVTKVKNSRKLMNHESKLRYYSSDPSVATVNARGGITAVGAGSCRIYAVAINGLYKAVTVTVK